MEDINKFLKENGVKPSIYRLKILEYLKDNHTHPTANTIYQDLVGGLPTLSRTTVYNTLNLFVEKGIVNPIVIEGNEIRYDVEYYPHGHFKCVNCNKMIDFEIEPNNMGIDKLGNIDVKEIQFYIKGLCENCKNK